MVVYWYRLLIISVYCGPWSHDQKIVLMRIGTILGLQAWSFWATCGLHFSCLSFDLVCKSVHCEWHSGITSPVWVSIWSVSLYIVSDTRASLRQSECRLGLQACTLWATLGYHFASLSVDLVGKPVHCERHSGITSPVWVSTYLVGLYIVSDTRASLRPSECRLGLQVCVQSWEYWQKGRVSVLGGHLKANPHLFQLPYTRI